MLLKQGRMNERAMEEKKAQFRKDCERYLSSMSLECLRSYGRSLQLRDPTKKKKAELIKEIVMVLCGELTPQRNNKGAPIKNDYISPQILSDIEKIKQKYFPTSIEEEPENLSVVLQLKINPALLNEKQRQLLNEFLDSL